MVRLPETLATARLHLRCPVMDLAGAIFRSYAQDPQVCRFMMWVPHVKCQEVLTCVR